ncbi:MAG: hypothetical protein ABJF01_10260 [bacterium]
MKSSQRHKAAALGVIALSFAAAPAFAQAAAAPAQRGGAPNGDTPQILVATFKSPDRVLGVLMADETRKRIQSEHNAKELYATPKNNINNTLEASGYRPDSALNAADLMELAKQLRADQVLDGTVTKAGAGVHVEARLIIKANSQLLMQPLPPVDGKDAGDAAKSIEKSLVEASKALPAYKKCTNDLRAAKYDEAATDARAGIALYSGSTFARLCLMTAFQLGKASPDSLISAANGVLTVDPTSVLALSNAAEAYSAKGEKDKSIEYQLRIYRADPTNTAIVTSIVNGLGAAGSPDKALPMIDSLLKDNPGDPAMLATKWKLQLAAKRYKDAIATGEELVKVDTAAATLDFFNRQIGAAQSDSNAAVTQTLAAKAAQKFPKEASFQLLLSQSYRKSGQLQQALDAAKRAVAIDPKNANAWTFVVVTAKDLNQPADSVFGLVQKGIAAGADKEAMGSVVNQVLNAAQKKATDAKGTPEERADWEDALKLSKAADAIAPSIGTKFFIGLSSFQVALDAINHAQTLSKTAAKSKDDKAKACEETKVAEDMAATTAIAMPSGGAFNKEAAGQILGALNQVQEAIPQFKKAFCAAK